MATQQQQPKCKRLVLDAGPLLSFSPLRGLAETFVTVPQVLAELRDNRAREHFEKLGLLSGVKVEVKSPDAKSLTHVIQWAKKTGDYSVLSHADLCVIALTYALGEEDKRNQAIKSDTTASESAPDPNTSTQPASDPSVDEVTRDLEASSLEAKVEYEEAPEESTDESIRDVDTEPLNVELVPIKDDDGNPESSLAPQQAAQTTGSDEDEDDAPLYGDPSDEDDGEGEWITPENVKLHKSRALGNLPDDGVKNKKNQKDEIVSSGCMTADFAMQNVILHMGLNLVGMEGKRIERVKNWVLRCHACFKVCKDNSKKFCPSCGNPSLIRASVTVSAPNASKDAPVMQVHLKPNFQYRVRGTKYSIPAPKHGTAKTGPGKGLILREDQIEYVRAKQRADGKREREEARLLKGLMESAAQGKTNNSGGNWMDPDWVPEILSVGAGGKGRTARHAGYDGDLPQIGYGRRNPNERRRKK